jgi:CIC family chloride channel protein
VFDQVRFVAAGGLPRLAAYGRRSRQVLLLAGATGAVTGLVVAGFDRLTADVLLGTLVDQPLWVQALGPALGLLLALACLRTGGRGSGGGVSTATSDEYIRAFHDTGGGMALRQVPFRIAASIATLGFGSPLGYEGPALYAGAGIGTFLQRRLRRLFSAEDTKVMLVAGAAAGVAAIFKAPVTGLVFALEVPYQEDLARRMLLPAAISAAASYVVFAAIAGTEPLLPVAGQPPFNLVDIGGAAVIGLVAGILARAFVALIHAAKALGTRRHPAVRVTSAGLILAATVVLANALGDSALALGPGYHALEWALDPKHSLLVIVALGTLRVAGTTASIAGGGVGGLFIPLVIQGALVGRAVGAAFEVQSATLFPVVGMAAFLGAGYRVPLAAVVFVAEFTGRPGFVVPGLIAAVMAQLVMGRASLSPYQVSGRIGHLERRLRLPLSTVVNTEVRTAPPDATVEEVFWQHLVAARQQSVAIVDDSTYLGMARAEDVGAIGRDEWTTTPVRQIMRTDLPVADMSWLLGDAIRAIEECGSDRIAVCDNGCFVGVITAADLVELDEILDRTENSG